jgi:formylglycine-generating enzyme required for sulfatase activity
MPKSRLPLPTNNVATPMSNLTIQKQKKTVQYFTEPLDSKIGLDMMLILGGSFSMGSPPKELDRQEREGPQHVVTVPTFFLGRYPVTQAQWSIVAALKKVKIKLNPSPSSFKGKSDHPVENVNWHEAEEFCLRLSDKTGRIYRLPSETEWEYACRAGTTTPFHYGETITTDLANYEGTDEKIGETSYSGSYGRGPKGIYRRTTTPVGSLGGPNAFGLYDMHGNVWEWCRDHWHSSYEGAPTDGSAWLSENDNESRILRGGSWNIDPRWCRSAFRVGSSPVDRVDFMGFRVVCDSPRTL